MLVLRKPLPPVGPVFAAQWSPRTPGGFILGRILKPASYALAALQIVAPHSVRFIASWFLRTK